MGKKTREDLSYVSKRRLKIERKTRISKCYTCNNYFCNTWTRVWDCPLCWLAILDELCPNPSQTAPIPAESSVSSSGPLTT